MYSASLTDSPHMDHGETGPEFPPLLPAPADLARPNDRLCSTCSALKLSPEYFVVGPNDKEPGDTITLGTVAEIMDKTYCPFCRLVWASLGGPDVPALDTRARGAAEELNDMGITFSRLRVTELGGMGMLAERDCRADMMQGSQGQCDGDLVLRGMRARKGCGAFCRT